MWPIAAMAGMVAAERRPCGEDNPFRTLERSAAASVEKGFAAVAKARGST
jgi:hypothetical protein